MSARILVLAALLGGSGTGSPLTAWAMPACDIEKCQCEGTRLVCRVIRGSNHGGGGDGVACQDQRDPEGLDLDCDPSPAPTTTPQAPAPGQPAPPTTPPPPPPADNPPPILNTPAGGLSNCPAGAPDCAKCPTNTVQCGSETPFANQQLATMVNSGQVLKMAKGATDDARKLLDMEGSSGSGPLGGGSGAGGGGSAGLGSTSGGSGSDGSAGAKKEDGSLGTDVAGGAYGAGGGGGGGAGAGGAGMNGMLSGLFGGAGDGTGGKGGGSLDFEGDGDMSADPAFSAARKSAGGNGLPFDPDNSDTWTAQEKLAMLKRALEMDPDQYFALIGKNEDLFKRISNRYQKIERRWLPRAVLARLQAAEKAAKEKATTPEKPGAPNLASGAAMLLPPGLGSGRAPASAPVAAVAPAAPVVPAAVPAPPGGK